MWIANSPLPPSNGTTTYRVFYEANGNVYMAALEKSGTAFLYSQTDGSFVDYTITFNQAAINSITQGLITGASVAGSKAGNSSEVPTVDLFGIGGHAVNGALAPADLQAHYRLPSGLNGAGQTIAIVDAPGSGDVADDLNVFSQYYNLPQCNSANPCFQHIDLSNGAPIQSNQDWGSEVELDTQTVHAVAPGAKIILVTANSQNLSDIIAAINYAAGLPGVTAVTMSFGYFSDPTTLQNEDNILSNYQTGQGVVFFASTGDSGNMGALGASYPATSPVVTAVGGTRINSVSWNVGTQSEVAWQFSGGGPSSYAAIPAWQTSYLGNASPITQAGMRAVPDVSAVADFQHSALAIYYKQRWVMSGGTSASSPIWAGISALFAQHLANEGKSLPALIKATPGGFNGLLYQSKLTQGSNVSFYDVISGSNDLTATPCPLCSAGPGYDEVTGLGAPNVTNLFANF
jgi:subtilase family serine protease